MALKDKKIYRVALALVNGAVRTVNKWQPAWQGQAEQVVGEAVTFVPTLPVNWAELPASLQGYFGEQVSWPGNLLYRLRQVFVSWHAVVFKNLSLFLPALAAPHWQHYYSDSYLLKQWLSKRVTPPQARYLALVHDQWTRNNYYHWMIDALPRLLVLREHYPDAQLIMPVPIASYARQTAELLGFSQFLQLNEAEVVRAATLLVPARVAPLGYHHPALLRQLRQVLTAALIPVAKPPTRRIFASRGRQKYRRLTDEPKILAILARHGFECIYFEDLSFAQQVALLHETEVLMGVHGANLTNLLFMQSGAKVVELFNQDKFLKLANANFENLIYYRLCSSLKLLYLAVPCQTTAGQEPSNDADVELSIAALESVLRHL